MIKKDSPRLRTADKIPAPFPLNQFPKDFAFKLGKEIVYLLAVKSNPSLEGPEWEEIFATCIDADWKPSNIGLDDVIKNNCAWGAKTVKSSNPETQTRVRLISGRNSPAYSFDVFINEDSNPNDIGAEVLDIWNSRVESVRSRFNHVRTIVLLKGDELGTLAVFEFDTIKYEPDDYIWTWNKNRNLQGFRRENHIHRFTWQPHGSQFTIIEDVPVDCLIVNIRIPEKAGKENIVSALGFDSSWVNAYRKNAR